MKEYYYSLVSYQIQRQIFVAACSTNTTLASSFTRNERELLVKGKRESFKNVCKWITNTSNCTLETRSHKAAELLLFFLIILLHGTFVKHWLVCLIYAIGSAKSGPKTRWNMCPILSGFSVGSKWSKGNHAYMIFQQFVSSQGWNSILRAVLKNKRHSPIIVYKLLG